MIVAASLYWPLVAPPRTSDVVRRTTWTVKLRCADPPAPSVTPIVTWWSPRSATAGVQEKAPVAGTTLPGPARRAYVNVFWGRSASMADADRETVSPGDAVRSVMTESEGSRLTSTTSMVNEASANAPKRVGDTDRDWVRAGAVRLARGPGHRPGQGIDGDRAGTRHLRIGQCTPLGISGADRTVPSRELGGGCVIDRRHCRLLVHGCFHRDAHGRRRRVGAVTHVVLESVKAHEARRRGIPHRRAHDHRGAVSGRRH